jgi:hypothetical protein
MLLEVTHLKRRVQPRQIKRRIHENRGTPIVRIREEADQLKDSLSVWAIAGTARQGIAGIDGNRGT